jgi:hypothetical protein
MSDVTPVVSPTTLPVVVRPQVVPHRLDVIRGESLAYYRDSTLDPSTPRIVGLVKTQAGEFMIDRKSVGAAFMVRDVRENPSVGRGVLLILVRLFDWSYDPKADEVRLFCNIGGYYPEGIQVVGRMREVVTFEMDYSPQPPK